MARDAGTLSTHGTALLQAGGGDFARESYLAEHLPYFALADDDAMVLREGDLLATLRLDGLNPMTTEDARPDALKRAVPALVAPTRTAPRVGGDRGRQVSRKSPGAASWRVRLQLKALRPFQEVSCCSPVRSSATVD